VSAYKITSEQQAGIKSVVQSIRAELIENIDEDAKITLKRFFKEDIKLYGMKTAVANKIGKSHLTQIKKEKWDKAAVYELCNELWSSGYQEEVLIACIFTEAQKKFYQPEDLDIFERWIKEYVSNWAMCDTLCNHTVGDLLMMYPKLTGRLLLWAKSDNRWVRRAAGVSLIVPARKGLFLPLVFEIADVLLTDSDDMVQKGYGWMLKAAAESGEAGQQAVYEYVLRNKSNMPRTALRYAIEKMPPYMKQKAMEK